MRLKSRVRLFLLYGIISVVFSSLLSGEARHLVDIPVHYTPSLDFPVQFNTIENMSTGEAIPSLSGEQSPMVQDSISNLSDSISQTETMDKQSSPAEIRATVGKSKIIKFAQMVKRIAIADPSLADLILLSPDEVILNGKTAGVTSFIVWDENNQPAFFDLYVKNDTSALQDTIKEIAPDESVDIRLTDDGNVILSGTLSSTILRDKINKIVSAYGYKLIDIAEVPEPQVMLEVKVSEASRALTSAMFTRIGIGSFADILFPKNIVTFGSSDGEGFPVQWTGSSTGVIGAIFKPSSRLLAEYQAGLDKGLITTLADPQLITTNATKAMFESVQEIPVPTSVDQNGNLAFDFKRAGVKLEFTPFISEKTSRVKIQLKTNVSELDSTITVTQPNGITIFGFKDRTAETTVELEEGESLLIAGLLRRNENKSASTIPMLGSIPILGKLFTSEDFQKGETELIIMLKPRIIRPGIYGTVLSPPS